MATDFNKKYGLVAEPVLDDAAVLSPDSLSSMFVRVDTGLMASLNDVQTALAQILLIPQVPESVSSTFRIAKRLYLFGRFEYGFYTVSHRYAFAGALAEHVVQSGNQLDGALSPEAGIDDDQQITHALRTSVPARSHHRICKQTHWECRADEVAGLEVRGEQIQRVGAYYVRMTGVEIG